MPSGTSGASKDVAGRGMPKRKGLRKGQVLHVGSVCLVSQALCARSELGGLWRALGRLGPRAAGIGRTWYLVAWLLFGWVPELESSLRAEKKTNIRIARALNPHSLSL
eukprot:scaffold5625_cov126-Isochrysis_galbana.AAC.2